MYISLCLQTPPTSMILQRPKKQTSEDELVERSELFSNQKSGKKINICFNKIKKHIQINARLKKGTQENTNFGNNAT